MPMNVFFIEDLNDVARSVVTDYPYATKCLHRLFMELKLTVSRGHARLIVTGPFPKDVIGILENNGVSVSQDSSSGDLKTIFSGWALVKGPDREATVESMFAPLPPVLAEAKTRVATNATEELD